MISKAFRRVHGRTSDSEASSRKAGPALLVPESRFGFSSAFAPPALTREPTWPGFCLTVRDSPKAGPGFLSGYFLDHIFGCAPGSALLCEAQCGAGGKSGALHYQWWALFSIPGLWEGRGRRRGGV
eukprot:4345723-Pyramimonas_sp.AAC.1